MRHAASWTRRNDKPLRHTLNFGESTHIILQKAVDLRLGHTGADHLAHSRKGQIRDFTGSADGCTLLCVLYHAQAKKFAVYGGCFEVLNTGFQCLIKAHGSLSLDKAQSPQCVGREIISASERMDTISSPGHCSPACCV